MSWHLQNWLAEESHRVSWLIVECKPEDIYILSLTHKDFWLEYWTITVLDLPKPQEQGKW